MRVHFLESFFDRKRHQSRVRNHLLDRSSLNRNILWLSWKTRPVADAEDNTFNDLSRGPWHFLVRNEHDRNVRLNKRNGRLKILSRQTQAYAGRKRTRSVVQGLLWAINTIFSLYLHRDFRHCNQWRNIQQMMPKQKVTLIKFSIFFPYLVIL